MNMGACESDVIVDGTTASLVLVSDTPPPHQARAFEHWKYTRGTG